jgi:hypothetical protein
VVIPWRPEADPTCPGGTAWRASDGSCYNGLAFNASFDFTSQGITLPDDVIIGVAYNTENWGANPIGVDGPYDSLNVGVAPNQPVTIGSDDNTDDVFWNTSTAADYSDLGAGGVGTFRQDTNWAPYGTVNLQVNADPVNLMLDKDSISDKVCNTKGAKVVVDVNYKEINDPDSGYGGNNWATDSMNRHLRIWSQTGGTYCVQQEDNGSSFTTVAGLSPSGYATVTAGIKGSIEGGYVTTSIVGTLSSTPAYATKGNLGTIDAGTLTVPLWQSYFSSITSSIPYSGWGWIYRAGPHGTWLDQNGVNPQSSGDITG